MNPKQIAKLNGKLLQDATEYLTYVRQLESIRAVFSGLGEKASPEQVEFLNEVAPIAEGAYEVVEEVMVATMALDRLPSSAQRHERRKCVAKLKEILHERAGHIGDVFGAILKAGALSDVNVEEVEMNADV